MKSLAIPLSLFVAITFVCYGDALIQLKTECPAVQGDVGACANLCSHNSDCPLDSWCCPNSCGGKSCAVVKASCMLDDIEFYHHEIIPWDRPTPDRCGICWCQNGKIACHYHPCSGVIP